MAQPKTEIVIYQVTVVKTNSGSVLVSQLLHCWVKNCKNIDRSFRKFV